MNSTNIETDESINEVTLSKQSDSLIDVDVIPTDATNQSSNSIVPSSSLLKSVPDQETFRSGNL